jgi:DNA-binding transcriptional ArsR family regulator
VEWRVLILMGAAATGVGGSLRCNRCFEQRHHKHVIPSYFGMLEFVVAPPSNRQLDAYAPMFAALGDEVRLRLIETLSVGGAKSITQLTSGVPISRQAVAKHLCVLAAAGWVRDVKIGRERLWEFEPARLAEAHRSLELIGRQWNSALAKLKALVESHPA